MADELQSEATSEVKEATPVQPEGPVSIANLDAPGNGSGNGTLGKSLAGLGTLLQGRGWIALVVVGILLVLFLFLPPVSLGARLMSGGGYTTLNAETPTFSHPDGASVRVNPDVVEKLRVKLDSVPRAEFLGDDASDTLQEAKAALPAYLSVKSPYYTLATNGKVAGPAELSVVIPNEAEPWETLDLYTWDGTAWQWIPSRLDRDREALVSDLDVLPASVVVAQTSMVQQAVVAEDEELPPTEFNAVLTHVDLIGMKIGTLGEMTGDPALLPPGSASTNPVLAPSVRNWVPDRPANRGLVVDMLTIEADRQAHVTNLTTMVQNGGYSGLVLDYQELLAEDREAYAGFVAELADALHSNGAWLAVNLDTPELLADGSWNTAGFDWQALGAAADQIRMVMPLDPQAYAPGGLAEQLVIWATSQVSRYKLYPVFSTLSTDGVQAMTMDAVLGSLGQVRISQPITDSVVPGTSLNLQFDTNCVVENDALTNATWLQLADTSCWLGTPQWLRARLDLSARYHLGGVVLRDLLGPGNFPGMVDAIGAYTAQASSDAYSVPDVSWKITGPNGEATEAASSLADPQFAWVAPEVTGTYRIAASVAGIDRGAVDVKVGQPVVEEDDETEEGEEEGTVAAASAEAKGLRASYVADVTVPDNTRFENGEKFTKTWRVRNSGSEAWPDDTVLTFVSGKELATVSKVDVGSAEPGEEVDVSVDMMAPNENGTFKAEWALSTDGSLIPNSSLWVVILAGDEAAAPAPAAPAPISGGTFELGGHVLGGFTYADKMHYSGMSWAKVQVRYPHDAAGIIGAAHANGFKIQISALGDAGMVTQGGFNETYANWVAGIAAAGADAIEVWNEPNLPREWQSGQINPQSYTQLLCASYSAIKAAAPGVAVISAAPAPTGYFGGCHGAGCDDIPWLQGMYNAGAANCMDYIGAHHNSGATPPSATSGHPADPGSTHHSWFFLPQTQIYYNIFGGARQLFYTELGYVSPEGFGWIPGTFAWGGNTTVAQQAQWLAEVVSLSQQTGMVRTVIVWNVDANCYGECGGVQDPQAGFAIIRPDGTCPACESLHALLGTR